MTSSGISTDRVAVSRILNAGFDALAEYDAFGRLVGSAGGLSSGFAWARVGWLASSAQRPTPTEKATPIPLQGIFVALLGLEGGGTLLAVAERQVVGQAADELASSLDRAVAGVFGAKLAPWAILAGAVGIGIYLASKGGGISAGGRALATNKVFISFDFDNDRDYRYLLSAFAANPKIDIEFQDSTPGAIDTYDVGRVKGVLTTKIRAATHTLVLVGKYANTTHRDSLKIGTRNWVWWEIEKSKEEGNKLVAVRLAPENPIPDPLLGAGAQWASYEVESIAKALREA
jgi:hypothetical protein